MMLWLGGIVILIGVIGLARGRGKARSPDSLAATGIWRRVSWPWVAIVIGCVFVFYGLQTRKPAIPLSYPSAMQVPSDRILTGHIAFIFGDAKLVEGETHLLDVAATMMKQHPAATMTMRARVYLGGAGYDTPEDRRRRAVAIRDHMMGAGISADRLFVDQEHDLSQSLAPGTYLRAYSGIDFVVQWN